MISRTHIFLLLLLSMAGSGCQIAGQQKQVRQVDPALPMTLSRDELVTYLNKQSQGLEGWRCTNTRMFVRFPNGLFPASIPLRLTGAIACQSPQYFRLTASNSIAHADLGSNARRCWMYAKPGNAGVMTWKHEDTDLLQQLPTGVPYIDPNWLMLVLGVTPLKAEDYEISTPPGHGRELWLTAIEESPSGRPLRRVIKVDTVRGVIREHAVYDSEAHPLVRAVLSDHCPCQGNLIPQVVKLQFPQMDSEMQLTFGNIEVNPALPDALWRLPDNKVDVVDLGAVVRRQLRHRRNTAHTANPHDPPAGDKVALLQPDFDDDAKFVPPRKAPDPFTQAVSASNVIVEEPVWDDEPAGDAAGVHGASYETPAPKFDTPSPPRRRGFWPFRRR